MGTVTSSQKIQQAGLARRLHRGLRNCRSRISPRCAEPWNTCEQSCRSGNHQPYLFWNAQHYTRNLIDKTELYELLAICWEPGMKSSIHNHKGQNCWMAAPIGRLAVQNYRVISEDLAAHSCDIVPTDEVQITAENPVAVDPLNPVHDVHNPREWNQRAVSLHVYSRPFDSCVVYSVEQCSCGEIGLQYTSQHGKLC